MESTAADVATTAKIPLLKTADQFLAWKARVFDKCWAVTGHDLSQVTDEECQLALKTCVEEKVPAKRDNWVSQCWLIITGSLHDDLLLKVTAPRGNIRSLLNDINLSLMINHAEEVTPLRLELYGATMVKDGNNDLQTYIAFLLLRKNKLAAHGKQVDEGELVAIFLRGLHPLYQPLQLHFSLPGNMPNTFDKAVAVVRRYSTTPAVVAELAKLKTPAISQHMFPVTSVPPPTKKPLCRQFSSKGSCTFGSNCKFLHTSTPAPNPGPNAQQAQQSSYQSRLRCAFCLAKGHTAVECRKRLGQLAAVSGPAPSTSSTLLAQPNPLVLDEQDNKHDDTTPFAVLVLNISARDNISNWVMDSGATSSATFSEEDCVNVRDCNIQVTAAGSTFTVSRVGTANVQAVDEQGRVQQLSLGNCLISDKFPYKLLSLQAFTKKGHVVTIDKDTVRISNMKNDVVLLGQRDPTSQLFLLKEASTSQEHTPQALLAKSYGGGPDSELLWKLHLRHGHRNFADVARQYNIPMPKVIPACTSCIMGKSHVHPPLSSGFERATRRAEGFHSDFRGPFSTATPQGYLYLLTITDDYTRRIFGFLCKSQTEWMEIWSKFVLRIEAEIGRPNCIAWILTDNGVYRSAEMTSFCSARGIQTRTSAPYAQWMNHTAERNMRTIGDMAVTTMVHANLPKTCWGYAVLHAIDVINRTAESSTQNSTSGFPSNFSRLERWKGHALPGQTKGLYPFGCLAFKHVPAALRTKLDAHANPSIYLGIDAKSRSYLLGSLYDLNLSVSVDVTFVENVFPFRRFQNQSSPASLLWGTDRTTAEGDPRLGMFDSQDPSGVTKALDRQTLKAIGAIPESDVPDKEAVGGEHESEEPTTSASSVKRSARLQTQQEDVKQDSRLWWPPSKKVSADNMLIMISENELQTITPKTAPQAVNGPSSAMWIAAMNREKQCHIKNGTFGEEWQQGATNAKPIPADWVFKIKHRGGPIEEKNIQAKQYKARVVVRGQYMKEGLDFNDTFAPVAKPMTIRAVFAVATKHSCMLFAGDVETAFLTSNMDCEVWVRMPPYWGKGDEPITGVNSDLPPRRLLKGVPGIPQGSRLFYETISAELHQMGYVPAKADQCLFLNPKCSERVAVLVWVDDFIFMCEKEQTWNSFIARLRQRFTIPDAGPLRSFLGMEIKYNPANKIMFISQASTVDTLLERGGLKDCTPLPVGNSLLKARLPFYTFWSINRVRLPHRIGQLHCMLDST
jgi:hypothetical protein